MPMPEHVKSRSRASPRRSHKAKPKKPIELRLDPDVISDREWRVYRAALKVIRERKIPFLLGGGFAQGTFTGRWRNTKDIDLYVMPSQREQAIDALQKAGFCDYFERVPYDRKWIYRSYMADCIVDIIWSMANHRAAVDSQWFDRAATVRLREEELGVVPIEEFLWCKLYILQRDRCDWVDIFNLLHFNAHKIDWEHLFARLEDDWPLLKGLLHVFCWVSPDPKKAIPASLKERLELECPPKFNGKSGRTWRDRTRFLDSRAWFAALNEKLEI